MDLLIKGKWAEKWIKTLGKFWWLQVAFWYFQPRCMYLTIFICYNHSEFLQALNLIVLAIVTFPFQKSVRFSLLLPLSCATNFDCNSLLSLMVHILIFFVTATNKWTLFLSFITNTPRWMPKICSLLCYLQAMINKENRVSPLTLQVFTGCKNL